MFDKKILSDIINNNDDISLHKIIRSKGFDPSNIIFSDNSSTHKKAESLAELYIKPSEIHGLGVFSKSNIVDKSIIEKCYAIELEFRNKYHKDSTIMSYCYSFDKDDEITKEHGRRLYLLTGYGLLYNHSVSPNSKWIFDPKNKICQLIAIQNIDKDSEITVNYNS